MKERRIVVRTLLFSTVSPDIDAFKSEVLSILESGVFPDNFIDSISRTYLLSEANNDLSVEFPAIRKPLALLSPAILDFSLNVYDHYLRHECLATLVLGVASIKELFLQYVRKRKIGQVLQAWWL